MFSLGIGLASKNLKGDVLDVFYPLVQLDPSKALADALTLEHPVLATADFVEVSLDALEPLSVHLPEIETIQALASKRANPHPVSLLVTLLAEDTAVRSTPVA